jgi:hypothetical protein
MDGRDRRSDLPTDRGYKSDAMLQKTKEAGMRAVIPPRKNRKARRDDDNISTGSGIWWKTPISA